jgi:hypothetical protein
VFGQRKRPKRARCMSIAHRNSDRQHARLYRRRYLRKAGSRVCFDGPGLSAGTGFRAGVPCEQLRDVIVQNAANDPDAHRWPCRRCRLTWREDLTMAKISRKIPRAADPAFVAINRHRLAWEHQNKVSREHTTAENRAARTKDGKETAEFWTSDRKWNAAREARDRRMRELSRRGRQHRGCRSAGRICPGDGAVGRGRFLPAR